MAVFRLERDRDRLVDDSKFDHSDFQKKYKYSQIRIGAADRMDNCRSTQILIDSDFDSEFEWTKRKADPLRLMHSGHVSFVLLTLDYKQLGVVISTYHMT